MIELIAAVAAGLAVGLFALFVIRLISLRPEDYRIRRLRERPQVVRRDLSSEEVMRKDSSRLPFLRGLLTNSAWAQRTELQIEQAGLHLRVGEYLIGRLGFTLAAFVVVALAYRSTPGTIVALACAGVAFVIPAIWLKALRQRRMDRIAKQLPEAVTLMANSLRAGFAFQHGVDMVAQQMEAPISDEFTRLMVDLNLGASVEEGLQGLMARADSDDMNLVVTAILIQRSSGGNLAEILDIVGETMRERERLTGEVRTMTAQQRFSGMVLSIWPLALLAFFSLINWDQTSLLFTTNVGLLLLGVMAVGQVLGFVTIRRILDIDI
ncbi:MAG: type II secretion system F family protein [Dehalococcoidia bacterium]